MRSVRITFWLSLLMLCMPFAMAAPSVDTVTVTANGKTQAVAIANALSQAIQQVNGVQVDVVTQLREKQPQIIMDWFGNRIVLPGGMVDEGYVRTQSNGPVKSYRVESSKLLEAQSLWQVTLAVDVVRYQPLQPQRSQLHSLAVAPFISNASSFDSMAGVRPASDVAADLGRLIRQDLVQSGRFRVLDRDFWPQMAQEESIIREHGQNTQQYIKQGQKLGADILLVGNIQHFDISKRSQTLYDSQTTLYHADFQVDVQLLETATGEILWSDRIQRVITHQQLRQQLQLKLDPLQGQDQALVEAEIERQLYQQIADDISLAMVGHFYPLRVLDTDGDQEVYLTQGDGMLKPGDVLSIYAPEAESTDPDTGLTVKRQGRKVALVEVTEVQTWYASARLLEGNIEAVQPQAIARKRMKTLPLSEPSQVPARRLTPGSSEQPLRWP